MSANERARADGDSFRSLCIRLDRAGRRLGIVSTTHAKSGPLRSNDKGSPRKAAAVSRLEHNLRVAGVGLGYDEVLIAGDAIGVISAAILVAASACVVLVTGMEFLAPLLFLSVLVPLIAREVLVSYPARLATRRAGQVLKHSAGSANLMIMSLRHEPSIPRAMAFASAHDDEFSKELRSCTWGVIMGKYESFEEALLNLGQKWGSSGEDLKTALNSMVTSSREATQDGRRRALDRANHAIVAGSKRRIEEYAMSLSTPSMLIFGLGILLPLMVGSFLPMLSWNLWSMDGMSQEAAVSTGSEPTSQMVFVMNILFPAIAFVVAMNAVSGHPLETEGSSQRTARPRAGGGIVTVACSAVLLAIVFISLEESTTRAACMLFSAIGPISIWLLFYGRISRKEGDESAEDLEDVLFRTGARMLEGENFESSLHKAAGDVGHGRSAVARRISVTGVLGTNENDLDRECVRGSFGMRNAVQGLSIAREAAKKDERAAGMLAMDLAAYIKDLRELESTLRNRLRPTMSMMKTTALVLAPVVLGVTYAIYLSLGAMVGSGVAVGANLFFLVLGMFLAQMDAVVVYFVWGIEGKKGFDRLSRTIGAYVLVSELAYSATAFLAAS